MFAEAGCPRRPFFLPKPDRCAAVGRLAEKSRLLYRAGPIGAEKCWRVYRSGPSGAGESRSERRRGRVGAEKSCLLYRARLIYAEKYLGLYHAARPPSMSMGAPWYTRQLFSARITRIRYTGQLFSALVSGARYTGRLFSALSGLPWYTGRHSAALADRDRYTKRHSTASRPAAARRVAFHGAGKVSPQVVREKCDHLLQSRAHTTRSDGEGRIGNSWHRRGHA